MNKLLAWFNNEYEKVLHSGWSEEQKTMEYNNLMKDMEREFNIPMIRDQERDRENFYIMSLYRKIAKSRSM